MFGVCAAVMSFTTLDAGPNAVPEVCTTIEEVGSTGVGALTITFIILVICSIVFLYKAVNSAAQKKCAPSNQCRTFVRVLFVKCSLCGQALTGNVWAGITSPHASLQYGLRWPTLPCCLARVGL
jgi:hypothetical protein